MIEVIDADGNQNAVICRKRPADQDSKPSLTEGLPEAQGHEGEYSWCLEREAKAMPMTKHLDFVSEHFVTAVADIAQFPGDDVAVRTNTRKLRSMIGSLFG
jgi:hypothetical protein